MSRHQLKRFLDILISAILLIVAFIPIFLIGLMIYITSPGPILFWSDRVGQFNSIFRMPKFRTMHVSTPLVATDLMSLPESYVTHVGSFLRKTSLDELPQLWTILTGNMSLVGPRPALFNQTDLIALRTSYGVQSLVPGLTGWAQVNGRDELTIIEKVGFDCEYLRRQSTQFDLQILWMTFLKVIHREGISH